MRGHVRKRGSKWAVIVELGRDPVTGKRRQKWHSGYATKREAESAVAGLVAQVNAGTYVEPSRLTVAAYFDQWLNVQRARLRPSTWESYRLNLGGRVVPTLGNVPLQSLTAAHLDELYAFLLEGGRKPREATQGASESEPTGLSPRTVRYVHTVVSRALSDAVRKGTLARNPADAADPPSATAAKAPEMKTWTAAQVRTFLDHHADDRLFALYLLAVSTGLRRAELLGLRWTDVDLKAARVTVRHTLIEGPQSPRESHTKNARGRNIALDAGTVAALKAHRVAQARERMALGPAYDDQGLVFAREDGTPMWPRSVSRTFVGRTKDAGLPVIRFHDLRHTHATLALQAGVHPKVVSERLGHASVSITLDVYSHAIPAMQEDAAEKVAALFS